VTAAMTTAQILATLDAGLRAAPDNPAERQMARDLAKALTTALPDRDPEVIGEALLHVITKAAGLAKTLHAKGIDDETILAATLNVVGIAGAELYARGAS
jgi:DNA-binding phage protein